MGVIMIAVFLSPLYIVLHVYLAWWLLHWLAAIHPVLGRVWVTVPLLILFSAISLSPLPAAFGRNRLKTTAKKISGWWLGILVYFLLLHILVFIIWTCRQIACHRSISAPADNTVRILLGALILLGTAALSAYGRWNAANIRRTSYHVTIPKRTQITSLKIALLADLHLGGSIDLKHVRKVCRVIRKINPDLIVIAGDIFDNDFATISQPDEIAALLRRLPSKYGCYACWGNHDIAETILAGFTFSSKNQSVSSDPYMDQFLDAAGVRLLKDETVLIDNAFYLSGRLDASCKEKSGITRLSPQELTRGLNHCLPILVMDHQPSQLKELSEAGVDLDLSGHTHDGQIFPGNITARIGWKNSCGMLQVGSMTSIVTSGAGTWGPALRIGTHSEVAEINVQFSTVPERV